MIKIGLDVATNTGIAVIEVDDKTHELKRIITIEQRELYFKHNVYEQVKAIKLLVSDICNLINVNDYVTIALERSNYSKHCASIFGEICGMLVLEFISQLATEPLIMQFSPDEGHSKMHKGRLEREQGKALSVQNANLHLPYEITDDDEADAFNIAGYCHLCRNNVNIHQQVVEHRQTKRNIEHELVKLYQKQDYWRNKFNSLIRKRQEQPNHEKAISTQIFKVGEKLKNIENVIKQLEQQRKGV